MSDGRTEGDIITQRAMVLGRGSTTRVDVQVESGGGRRFRVNVESANNRRSKVKLNIKAENKDEAVTFFL